MAKPGSHSNCSATSSIPSYSNSSARPHTYHSEPHSRRRAHCLNNPGPSSGLLAILATVAASSSTAEGHPLDSEGAPPDFLCPPITIKLEAAPEHPLPSPSGTTGYLPAAPPASSRRAQNIRRGVPDKYERGPDGRWRKSGQWSLYGSSSCQCEDAVSTSVPVVDDSINPSQSNPTAMPAAFDSASSSLPSGWSRPSRDNDILDPIIVSLALLLAVMICLFITGCVTWRKKRRALLQKDPEKRARKKSLDGDSSDETEEMKQMRSQQKLWSKATARWKANVRLSARRRRAKRTTAPKDTDPHMSSTSLSSSHPEPVAVPSRTAADPDISDNAAHPGLSTSTAESGTAEITAPVSPSAPFAVNSLPPAYRMDRSSVHLTHSGEAGRSSTSDPRGKGIADTHDGTASPQIHVLNEDSPYDSSVGAAHIATDDKALLARMAELASTPPQADPSTHAEVSGVSSGHAHPSVPILDEFEEVPLDLDNDPHDLPAQCHGVIGSKSCWDNTLPASPSSPSSVTVDLQVPSYPHQSSAHPPMFPSPPSKGRLAEPAFYNYPPSFEEDIINAEPESGPSAPPFEFTPSQPPLEGVHESPDVSPSAPPFADDGVEIETEDSMDIPSAPPVDPENLSEHDFPSCPMISHARPSSGPSSPYGSPPQYLP